jgi:hypothetical protein
MMTKQYVLEWSKKSNGFHIQPLDVTLANNQKRFMADNSHDWMVLMVGSNEACQAMADNNRERLYARIKPMMLSEILKVVA